MEFIGVENADNIPKRKKINISKNRKKAWKKHIDISEIEDLLENKRLQEINGGISEDLVVEDGRPEVEEPKAPKKKFKLDLDNLKCYHRLKSQSKVNPPNKLAQPRTQPQQPTKLRQWLQERTKKQALKKSTSGVITASMKRKAESDEEELLWNDEEEEGIAATTNQLEPWVEHDLRVRGKLRPKPSRRFYQPASLLRGQELPTHGQSAHPHPGAHQNLMLKAHQEELARLVEDSKWRQKLYVPRDQCANKETRLEEALQGLTGDENSEEETQEIAPLIKPPIRPENRKTKKQRRKEKLQKAKVTAAQDKKLAKLSITKVGHIKAMARELRAKERATAAKSLLRAKKQAMNKLFKTHILGPHKFQEKPLATQVALTEELPAGGSMRLLTPISGQGTNIYKGLLRKNLIEPRVKQKLAKRKLKNRLHDRK